METCETCRFSVGYPDPGPEPILPERSKPKWWHLTPLPYTVGEFALMARVMWQIAATRHERMVHCRRFPDHQQRYKTDYCGEYSPTPAKEME